MQTYLNNSTFLNFFFFSLHFLENDFYNILAPHKALTHNKNKFTLVSYCFLINEHSRSLYFIRSFLILPNDCEMATHSSVLAWRIPGTGEPGGLPSMGSHRVGHDWSGLASKQAMIVVGRVMLTPICLWPNRWKLWMLCSMAKGTLHMWLKLKTLKWWVS